MVVPLADATHVAGACAALRLHVDVVPAEEAGSAIVPRTGADPAVATAAVSRLFGRADVVLLVRSGGQVQAQRWRGGVMQDEPPAGLALSALPEVVERLVLSDGTPDQEPGVVDSAGVPRTAATRSMLAIHRAGADPANARRMRRVDLVGSSLLLVALLVLLAMTVSAVAAGSGQWWFLVVVAVAVAAAGWWVATAVRRPS